MPIVSACVVKNIIDINKNVKKYTFKLSKTIPYEPGQFLHLTTENVSASDYWPSSRAFSIASYSPEKEDEVEVYIKNNGGYTKEIFNDLSIGSSCTVKYPYGDFILPELNDKSRVVGICNGVGITPLLSIMNYLNHHHKLDQFYLHYSVANLNDLIGKEIIEKIPVENLSLYVTRQPTEKFIQRRINSSDFIERYPLKETTFLVSGSNSFIDDITKILSDLHYENIITDSWR